MELKGQYTFKRNIDLHVYFDCSNGALLMLHVAAGMFLETVEQYKYLG